MVQSEKLKEKEAEAGVIDHYEKAIRQAKERVLRAKSGKKIIKAKEKPSRIVWLVERKVGSKKDDF